MRSVATIGASRQAALHGGDHCYVGSVCKKDASHGSVRITSSGNCHECHKARQARATALHYESNKALYKARAAEWAAANPDKRKVTKAKYRRENADSLKAYNRRWWSQNKGKRAAYEAARRSLKLRATIPGYEDLLVAFYVNCPEGFVVDHMVPLNGKTVCGLHVPWNLQYLPSELNSSKSNKLFEALAISPALESQALH